MNSMKLYFHPLSGSSRRALMAAIHLKASVERVVVDLDKGEQKGVPHMGRNPNGRVPVLDDNGTLLWESRAIMQYLADKTPGQTLYPTDLLARADVNRWLFWDAAHMNQATTVLVHEHFVNPVVKGIPTDPAAVARAEELFHVVAGILDAQLAGKEWITQDRLTLVDYAIGAEFALAGPAKFPIATYKNIQAWFARVQELPAWKETNPPRPA